MKNLLLTLLAITFLTTACKKEDLKPDTNTYNIEVIKGTQFWVQTSDTSFMFRTTLNNKATVKGTKLYITNMSKSDAIVKVNGYNLDFLGGDVVDFDKYIEK